MSSTDVLKADRILIEDRVYRLLPIRESLKIIEDDEPRRIPRTYIDKDDHYPDVPIIHQGDNFIATIHVPEALIGFIVGKNFKNISALQQQYQAKINIPDKKNREAGITIQDSRRETVALIYLHIQNKLNEGRFKTDFTHFVSFPVNSSKIPESFLEFKDEVLTKCNKVKGIDTSIFQKSTKLHITIATLVLLDERDRENAIAVLNNCTNSFLKELGEKEIVVRVKGLEIMNDDEAEVCVLYAKLHELDDDNRLQILADKIMNEFVEANLSRKNYADHVKLHVTLMNTRFRQQLDGEDENEQTTFDARKILKEFGDYDFGQIALSNIHISIRYTEASDGFYNHLYKLKLKS